MRKAGQVSLFQEHFTKTWYLLMDSSCVTLLSHFFLVAGTEIYFPSVRKSPFQPEGKTFFEHGLRYEPTILILLSVTYTCEPDQSIYWPYLLQGRRVNILPSWRHNILTGIWNPYLARSSETRKKLVGRSRLLIIRRILTYGSIFFGLGRSGPSTLRRPTLAIHGNQLHISL